MKTVKALRTGGVRSRDRILETATQLFSRHGFTSTSLSELAERAHVSKGLIFWHLHSKDSLFRAALQSALDACAIDVIDDLQGLSEIDQLKRLTLIRK